MATAEYVYGYHAVAGLIANNPDAILELIVAEGRAGQHYGDLASRAQAAGIAVRTLPRREIDRLQPGMRHQGILARVAAVTVDSGEPDLTQFLEGLEVPPFLLVLDGVQDPHNLGACLRTADAAGVHAVIVPRDRAARITPTVRKVASGAAETVPVFSVTNLARTLRQLRDAGVWIYGASDTADTSLYQTDMTGPLALVLGGEGKGLRRLTREHCDYLVAIPMAGQVESLNVSVAAGILLYEAHRQRGTQPSQ